MKRNPHQRQAGRRWRLMVRLGVFLTLAILPGAGRAIEPPPTEGGKAVLSIPMSGITAAPSCVVSLPWFGHQDLDYIAPHGTITMTDGGGTGGGATGGGGWCALQFVQVFRELIIVPGISVVEAPSHGEARAERMPGRLAVVYRPAPGFVGTDHFAVRTDGPLQHTIPIDVTVR
jgi:hypothetical protein